MKYEHTQIGYLMITVLSAVTLLFVFTLMQSGFDPILFGVMVLALLIVSSFTSLNVKVDRQFLKIKFGYGIFRKKFNLEEIVSSEIVKNHWYYGWGIRFWPIRSLWIFSVSGFNAVEIKMKNGRNYRIGTDDPKGLELALKTK